MGGFSFLAGFVVLLFRPGDRRARIFYWLSLSFGATVIVGGGTYGVHGRLANLLPGVLFNIAYPMTLALLLWFARSYAPPRPRSRPVLFWSVPALWGVLLSSTFLVSQLGPSIGAYRLREDFKHVFRFYVIIVGVAALVEFARALRSTDSEEDRAQIKWYLIGLAAGLGPFLAFNQLPLVVMDRPLLSESFALVFFLLIPVFMVISILQFRLLRVNIVFHRGLVYSILTVFTLGVFLLAVEGLRRVFPRATATGNVVITLGAAVFIAVLLSPGRRAIQDFVDQLFFRQSYDYRRAVQTFRAAAPGIIDADDLIALHAGTMRRVLPMSTVGLLILGPRRLVGLDEGAAAKLEVLALDADRTWARAARVRTFEDLDLSREDVLESAGAEIVMALPRGAGTPPGLLVFGRKLSGHRFTKEDIGLIETMGGELAVNLGRIRIQEQMIYERASREKTEELVRLKTEFISSVAHELRTPITSLDGLSGLLRSGKVGDPDKRQRLARAPGRRMRPADPVPHQRPRLRPDRGRRQGLRSPADGPGPHRQGSGRSGAGESEGRGGGYPGRRPRRRGHCPGRRGRRPTGGTESARQRPQVQPGAQRGDPQPDRRPGSRRHRREGPGHGHRAGGPGEDLRGLLPLTRGGGPRSVRGRPRAEDRPSHHGCPRRPGRGRERTRKGERLPAGLS